MPPHPKEMALRSLRASPLSSQHPTGDKPRHVLARSHNPDRPYHSALSVSPDGRIKARMASPRVGYKARGVPGARGFEQNVSQPRRIAPLKVERLAKYPSLVSAARVRRTQTVVLELTNIEDSPIAVRQTPCHAGAQTSHHLDGRATRWPRRQPITLPGSRAGHWSKQLDGRATDRRTFGRTECSGSFRWCSCHIYRLCPALSRASTQPGRALRRGPVGGRVKPGHPRSVNLVFASEHYLLRSLDTSMVLPAYARAGLSRSGVSGARRRRRPDASKTALARAAATGRIELSPAPAGGSSGRFSSTMSTASGASVMSRIG